MTKVFGPKGEKVTGNSVVRSFMACGPRKILSVWSIEGGLDGQGT